ncbi:GNAT family N-acetyltransferase [Verrucomicrobiota bacterium sgz303538]
MIVRGYVPDDADALADLFTESVHRVACADYSAEQCAAWAPVPPDYERWRSRLSGGRTLVAEMDGAPAGFATFVEPDCLDLLYVHPDRQRQGVAAELLRKIEGIAREANAPQLTTYGSLTARSFFERSGFSIVRANIVYRRGVEIQNFLMSKPLQSLS